jgi:alpha-glucosidase
VSRWSSFMPDREKLGRFCIALLCALRGSICLYQGEELGFPESDVPFDLIQDPYGKTFWPEFKGRDGCRSPMAWERDVPNAGFSKANRTWLPVDPAHKELAADKQAHSPVSLFADYRKFLAIRRDHEALRTGDIAILPAAGDVLAFTRKSGDERLLCVFNFGLGDAEWELPPGLKASVVAGSDLNASLAGNLVRLAGGGAIYLNLN